MAVQTDVGGTGSLTINGAATPIGGSLSEKTGGKTNKPKVALDGTVRSTSAYMVGELDIEFFNDGSFTVAQIQALTGATVIWEPDNANLNTVVYTGCFYSSENVEVNQVEGTLKFRLAYAARNEV